MSAGRGIRSCEYITGEIGGHHGCCWFGEGFSQGEERGKLEIGMWFSIGVGWW